MHETHLPSGVDALVGSTGKFEGQSINGGCPIRIRRRGVDVVFPRRTLKDIQQRSFQDFLYSHVAPFADPRGIFKVRAFLGTSGRSVWLLLLFGCKGRIVDLALKAVKARAVVRDNELVVETRGGGGGG